MLYRHNVFRYPSSCQLVFNAPLTKYWLDDFYIKDNSKKFLSWKRAKCQVPLALDMIVTLAAVMRPGSPSSKCVRRIWMRHQNHCLHLEWFHLKWASSNTISCTTVARGQKFRFERLCQASEPTKGLDYIWTFLFLLHHNLELKSIHINWTQWFILDLVYEICFFFWLSIASFVAVWQFLIFITIHGNTAVSHQHTLVMVICKYFWKIGGQFVMYSDIFTMFRFVVDLHVNFFSLKM